MDAADSPLYHLCRRALSWLLVCCLPVILLVLLSGSGYLLLPSSPAAAPVVPSPGEARPYTEQLEAVADRYRGGVVLAVVPPAAPDEPTRVRLRTQSRVELAVLVDPSRAEVLGEVDEASGITGGLTGLHQQLSLGRLGTSVAELAMIGSALFSVTGVVLLWRRRGGWRWFGLAGAGLLVALVLGGFGWLPAWDRLFREASGNPPLPGPVPMSNQEVRPGDLDALGRPVRPAADGMPVPRSVGAGGTGLVHDPAVPDPEEGGDGGDPDVAVADLETVIAAAARYGMPAPLEIVLPQTWGGTYLVREGDGAPPHLWQRRTLYLDQYTARAVEPVPGAAQSSHAHRVDESPANGLTDADVLRVAGAAGPLVAMEFVRAGLLFVGVLWFRWSRPSTAGTATSRAPEPAMRARSWTALPLVVLLGVLVPVANLLLLLLFADTLVRGLRGAFRDHTTGKGRL
ncbi:PepSY domain-containing protein [Amycolatopsis sp. YIM 10]|uniref:PepSY domain-containing protein n=1 Tax=Amycolatopsis sp. YIM 10 TaxID=2653857 RepID=UPI0018840391|nr:PepSY domain-containing protein [Amycolatopsis sp. YIM 10]